MRVPSFAGARRGRDTAPAGFPELRPYAHLGPDDGACLMETASLLAGEPFTDEPRRTAPALAALARTVNDAVGPSARRRLLPLASELADARPAERSFEPLLVAEALRAARLARPRTRGLAMREGRCRRRAARVAGAPTGRSSRARDAVWWHGPGRHHLERALRTLLDAPDAEDRLVRLLHEAVASAKACAAEASRARPRDAAPVAR